MPVAYGHVGEAALIREGDLERPAGVRGEQLGPGGPRRAAEGGLLHDGSHPARGGPYPLFLPAAAQPGPEHAHRARPVAGSTALLQHSPDQQGDRGLPRRAREGPLRGARIGRPARRCGDDQHGPRHRSHGAPRLGRLSPSHSSHSSIKAMRRRNDDHPLGAAAERAPKRTRTEHRTRPRRAGHGGRPDTRMPSGGPPATMRPWLSAQHGWTS